MDFINPNVFFFGLALLNCIRDGISFNLFKFWWTCNDDLCKSHRINAIYSYCAEARFSFWIGIHSTSRHPVYYQHDSNDYIEKFMFWHHWTSSNWLKSDPLYSIFIINNKNITDNDIYHLRAIKTRDEGQSVKNPIKLIDEDKRNLSWTFEHWTLNNKHAMVSNTFNLVKIYSHKHLLH